MAFWDKGNKFPYTNNHDANLDYMMSIFENIKNEWHDLYVDLVEWKGTTTLELNTWKTNALAQIEQYETDFRAEIAVWKANTEQDIGVWEQGVLADLGTWRANFETLFATTFTNLSQIKTDAEAARDAAAQSADAALESAEQAESSAESVSSALTQIATNTGDISDLKTQLSDIENDFYEFTPLSLTARNGYWAGDVNPKTFYDNASYKSVDVSCGEHEIYKISNTVLSTNTYLVFWNENDNKISSIEAPSTVFIDEEIETPTGCTSFTVRGYCGSADAPNPITVKARKPKTDTLDERVDDIEDDISNIENDIGSIEDDVSALEGRTENLETSVSSLNEHVDFFEKETMPYHAITITEQNGFYPPDLSTKTFTPTDSYKSVSVNCAPGEFYEIDTYLLTAGTSSIGAYWDSNGDKVGVIGTYPKNEVTNYKIVIPENCASFTVNAYAFGNHLHPIVIKKGNPEGTIFELPLTGYKFMTFGDSITATANRWRGQFIRDTGAEEIHCYAVGGATLVDWAETILNGNISDGAQNTVCNQVTQMLLNPPADIPDFVVISAGTNDSWTSEELNATTNTQFVDTNHDWIDIDNVDRKKPDGAMRWQAEKIWSVYPNTIIIFGAPIQCAEAIHTYALQRSKNLRMELAANQLSCNIILGAFESGIYGRYEAVNTNGKYLADGIHPNADGGILLGHVYARRIMDFIKGNKA